MDELIVSDGVNALARLGFHDLGKAPPEFVWLANMEKETTRRNYLGDVESFMRLFELPMEKVRDATSAHVVAWRMHLKAEGNTGSTIRRRLAGLSSLFAYLREQDIIASNPDKDISRPKAPVGEGLTARLSDAQAKRLLGAPSLTCHAHWQTGPGHSGGLSVSRRALRRSPCPARQGPNPPRRLSPSTHRRQGQPHPLSRRPSDRGPPNRELSPGGRASG